VRKLGIRQVRKPLIKAIVPLAMVPLLMLGSETAANAAITTDCASGYCDVMETMGSGDCNVGIYQTGNFVSGVYINQEGTGYTCQFWIERDVNDSGWYDISGPEDVTPENGWDTAAYWDGSGYQARGCFEFIWSSTSTGATHCTPAL